MGLNCKACSIEVRELIISANIHAPYGRISQTLAFFGFQNNYFIRGLHCFADVTAFSHAEKSFIFIKGQLSIRIFPLQNERALKVYNLNKY
jgi:hypothetical protein